LVAALINLAASAVARRMPSAISFGDMFNARLSRLLMASGSPCSAARQHHL